MIDLSPGRNCLGVSWLRLQINRDLACAGRFLREMKGLPRQVFQGHTNMLFYFQPVSARWCTGCRKLGISRDCHCHVAWLLHPPESYIQELHGWWFLWDLRKSVTTASPVLGYSCQANTCTFLKVLPLLNRDGELKKLPNPCKNTRQLDLDISYCWALDHVQWPSGLLSLLVVFWPQSQVHMDIPADLQEMWGTAAAKRIHPDHYSYK